MNYVHVAGLYMKLHVKDPGSPVCTGSGFLAKKQETMVFENA